MEQACHGMLLRFLARPHLELLDFIWFVVVNGDGTDVIAVCWNCAVSCCVCLQRADDHVLARISVSGCNDESVVLLVRVSWCKRWSLHTCPPSLRWKAEDNAKGGLREISPSSPTNTASFLVHEEMNTSSCTSRRELLLHEVQTPVRTVNLSSSSVLRLSSSSSCVLRWALAPAADSSSWTRLVQNSFIRSVVLCTRLQLFLLYGLNQTAGALPVAVHVSELTLHMTLVGEKFPRA